MRALRKILVSILIFTTIPTLGSKTATGDSYSENQYIPGYYFNSENIEGIAPINYGKGIITNIIFAKTPQSSVASWIEKSKDYDRTGILYAGTEVWEDEFTNGISYDIGHLRYIELYRDNSPYMVAKNVNHASMTATSSGSTVYLAFCISGDGKSRVRLQRWTQSQGWGLKPSIIKMADLPVAGAYNEQPSVTLDKQGLPVVAWKTSIEGKAVVAISRWSTKSSAWVDFAGNAKPGYEIVKTPPELGGKANHPRLSTDGRNNIFLMWLDKTSRGTEALVAKRTKDGWKHLDGTDITMTSSTSTSASLPRIACDKKTFAPIIAFCEKGTEIHIRRWNGSRWVNIDGSENETQFTILDNFRTTEGKKSGTEPIGLDISSDDGLVTILKYDKSGIVTNFYDIKINSNKELLLNLKDSSWDVNGNKPLPTNTINSGLCVNTTPNPVTGAELWLSIPGKGTGKIRFGYYRLQFEPILVGPGKPSSEREKKVHVMAMGLAGCPRQDIRMFATTSSKQAIVKLDETYGRLAPGWVMPATITVTADQNLKSSTEVEIEIEITGDGGKTLITEKTKVVFTFDTEDDSGRLLADLSNYYYEINLLPPGSDNKYFEFWYIHDNNLPIKAELLSKPPPELNVTISPNPFTPNPPRRGDFFSNTNPNHMTVQFSATEKVVAGVYYLSIRFTRGTNSTIANFRINILDFIVNADMTGYHQPEKSIISSTRREYHYTIECRKNFDGKLTFVPINPHENATLSYKTKKTGDTQELTITADFANQAFQCLDLSTNVLSNNTSQMFSDIDFFGDYYIDYRHEEGFLGEDSYDSWSIEFNPRTTAFDEQKTPIYLSTSKLPDGWTAKFNRKSPFYYNSNNPGMLHFWVHIPKGSKIDYSEIEVYITINGHRNILTIPVRPYGLRVETFTDDAGIDFMSPGLIAVGVTGTGMYNGYGQLRITVKPPVRWIGVELGSTWEEVVYYGAVYTWSKIRLDGGMPSNSPSPEIGFVGFIKKYRNEPFYPFDDE